MLIILESLDENGSQVYLVINKMTKKTVATFNNYESARAYLLGK